MSTYAEKYKDIEEKIIEFSNGVKVFNACNHAVTFQDGDKLVSVPPGFLVNARFEESPHSKKGAAVLVNTEYVPEKESEKFVKWFKQKYPDVLIVGSAIAAKAFPEYVVVMTPVPGTERVRDGLKRKSIEKFTTFAEVC